MDKLAKQTIKKENIEVNIKMSKSEGKNIVWKVAVREGQQYTEELGRRNRDDKTKNRAQSFK